MAEEKKAIATEQAAEAAENTTERENVITLSRPYLFEGKEYAEVDLSGIEKLTVQDAIDAQKELFGQQDIAASVITETTTAFARAIAVKATGMPVEFFRLMPRMVERQIMTTVRNYMNADKDTENHSMKLEKPYVFGGKEYTEVDLSGLANLTGMNESEAENRMVRQGVTITYTALNFLYPCIVASMATGLPEEFFKGLPIRETLKLKAVVNDPDFFE